MESVQLRSSFFCSSASSVLGRFISLAISDILAQQLISINSDLLILLLFFSLAFRQIHSSISSVIFFFNFTYLDQQFNSYVNSQMLLGCLIGDSTFFKFWHFRHSLLLNFIILSVALFLVLTIFLQLIVSLTSSLLSSLQNYFYSDNFDASFSTNLFRIS